MENGRSEVQAYQILQKLARQSRRPVHEVAQKLLSTRHSIPVNKRHTGTRPPG
jgi:AmiR/NasT family two-component response regulator